MAKPTYNPLNSPALLILSRPLIIMAVFSIFSTVAFLRSSHGRARKSAKTGGDCNSKKNPSSSSVKPAHNKRPVQKIHSSLSSKALLKMISWRRVHEEQGQYNGYCSDSGDGDGDDDDDEPLWSRTIMKGEKCRPLDFSGKIVYDSHGNLLPS